MSVIKKLQPRLQEMTVELKREWVKKVLSEHANSGVVMFGKSCECYETIGSRVLFPIFGIFGILSNFIMSPCTYLIFISTHSLQMKMHCASTQNVTAD